MSTGKTGKTATPATPAVTTLPLEQGEAPVRSDRGIYKDTLTKMVPNSKFFFKVVTAQRSSVIHAAHVAGMKIQTVVEKDSNKKATGFIKVWRKA